MAEKDHQSSSEEYPWDPPPPSTSSGSTSTNSEEDDGPFQRLPTTRTPHPGTQPGEGGSPAIRDERTTTGLGLLLKSETPEYEGVGVYASAGPGTPRTPFRPPRGWNSPRSPAFAAFQQHALRRASGATAGSARAGHFRNRGITAVLAEGVIYLENPDIPDCHREGSHPEYAALRNVTEPERDGMLELVDPRKLLQSYIANATPDIQGTWADVLDYYDIAMKGKCDAIFKLAGAFERLDDLQEHVSSLEATTAGLREEKGRLVANLTSLEKMMEDKRGQTRRLEREKGVLAREKDKLEKHYSKANDDWDAQLGILEDMIAEWETRSGMSETSSQPRSNNDREARVESIRKAIREMNVATKMAEANCERLAAQCDDLLGNEIKMTRFSGSSGEHSDTGELEQELPHQTPEDDNNNAEWWIPRPSAESSMRSTTEQPRTEVERLEAEVVRYKEQCASLQDTVARLETRLGAQAAEAAQEKLEHNNSLDEIANSVNDIDAAVSRVVSGSETSPDPDSFAGSTQESLLTKVFIRDVEATQLQAMESSRAVMDEIKAKIADLVKRVSTELAETRTAQAVEKQQILEEVTNYIATVESWIQTHRDMEGNQGLMEEQLDALRKQVHSQQQVFHEIGEQVRQQRDRVEAAKSASQHSGMTTSISSFVSRPRSVSEGPVGSAFDAGPDEIRALREARKLIAELKSISKDALTDPTVCAFGERLTALRQRLRELEPGTPTEKILSALVNFLVESSQGGIENDKPGFYTKLDEYDRDLKSLLELQRFALKETEAERALFIGVDEKLEAAEKLQAEEMRLVKECKAYREKHAPLPLTASQSDEVVRLISSVLASSGGSWSQAALADRGRASSMGQLVARIRRMVSDPDFTECRRELKDVCKRQEVLMAELTSDVSQLTAMARSAQEEMMALSRLRERGWRPSARGYEEIDCVVAASQQRRETALRHMRDYADAYLSGLDTVQEETKAFLTTTAADDRRHAEQLLTGTLFRLHGSGAAGAHGEAACFCTLLRYLFPRAYYSTVVGGCCAGSSATHRDSDSALEPSCHGHHGHGVLASSGRVWTSACRVLTFLTWLILLVLIQPYNLVTSARASLVFLFGMPIYLWHLFSETPVRPRLRSQDRMHDETRDQKEGQDQDQKEDQDQDGQSRHEDQGHDQPPNPTLSRLPEPATMVGAAVTAFLFYAWLSYAAVVVERQTWVGDNDWRSAYVRDLMSVGPVPFARGSPAGVDYRLVYGPVWASFAGWAHSLFSWSRSVRL